MEENHKRRVRYKGTHPKQYHEKYKELHPEKYPETVERVIQKGSTPVGMHLPIMVQEILDILQIKPGEKGLDATLGYDGHARAIVSCKRKGGTVETTTELQQVIEQALAFLPETERKDAIKKSCQRTFQALRIDINHEFEVLCQFMEKLPGALASGGRARSTKLRWAIKA